jgi:hypothetical protein
MIVSINQPAYLPWLGYFDRIAASDLHIVLDHVQFEKNSFVNRNKVRTAKGWTWLTVPVETSGRFGALAIDKLRIAGDPRWARKHWLTIEQSYAAAPHFAAHRAVMADLYARPWERLIDLVEAINASLLEAFAIAVPRVRSSTLAPAASKSDLVLELCRRAGATTYLSGPLGRDYLDMASFAAAGIAVVFHDYRHPVYAQAHPGFEPGMAAIDLLFMQGSEAGRTLRTTELIQGSFTP